MRTVYSYLRLLIASCLFVGGVALLFLPSAGSVARNARWRERQLQTVPAHQRADWIYDQDLQDARNEAYVKVFGVVLGGLGLGGALLEAAYLCALYGRHDPRVPA